MKWIELPQKYRDLERGFPKEVELWADSNSIFGRFIWSKTPQGYDFWGACDEAKTIDELPDISYGMKTKQQITERLEWLKSRKIHIDTIIEQMGDDVNRVFINYLLEQAYVEREIEILKWVLDEK